MNRIYYQYNQSPFTEVRWSKFPTGEINVCIHLEEHPLSDASEGYFVHAYLSDSEGVVALLQTLSILKNAYKFSAHSLLLTKVPYAQQDRICNRGESLAIKVFADMINHYNLHEVIIIDPHSDVTPALFNNCRVVDQLKVFKLLANEVAMLKTDLVVAPDAGAAKKASMIAKYLKVDMVQASKARNVQTGEITDTNVPLIDSTIDKNSNILIPDDICLGGRTFIELAKALNKQGYYNLMLFVTHGVFNQGTKTLREYFKEIYTTDSYLSKDELLSIDSEIKVLTIGDYN